MVAVPGDQALWERFLTSAGFGGLMAVVAAGIAYLAVRAQVRSADANAAARVALDRETASRRVDLDRATARRERWQELLEWVWTQCTRPEGALPHPDTVLAMLVLLYEESETHLQAAMVEAILANEVHDRRDPGSQASSEGTVNPTEDEEAHDG